MIEIASLIGVIALVLYYFAAPVIGSLPRLGYAMTFPVRIAFPLLTWETYGSIEGLLIGLGMAFILSFEHNIFWKVGVGLLFASELWHTSV